MDKTIEFKKLLKTSRVKFTYTKTDGTTRKAVGTLCEAYMPKLPQKKDDEKAYSRTFPESSILYFDLEKNGFRSFRKENLKDFTVLEKN